MAVPLGGPRMDPGLAMSAGQTRGPVTFDQSQVSAESNVAMVTVGVEGKRKPTPELAKQVSVPVISYD